MGILDKALETDALAFSYGTDEFDVIGISGGNLDPSIAGVDAPIGSLYLQTTGKLWQKKGVPDIDWTDISAAASGKALGYDGVILTAIGLTASNKVMIGVDTTNGPVIIDLPDVSLFLEKIFFIKWVKGWNKNKLKVRAFSGDTVDDLAEIELSRIKDSIEVIGAQASEWWII